MKIIKINTIFAKNIKALKIMKKSLFSSTRFALCFGLLFIVVSCNKDKDGDNGDTSASICYTCVSTNTTIISGVAQDPTTTQQTVCGVTDVAALEKSGTHSVTSGDVTSNTVMHCTRQ
jgi:hypothetical protein